MAIWQRARILDIDRGPFKLEDECVWVYDPPRSMREWAPDATSQYDFEHDRDADMTDDLFFLSHLYYIDAGGSRMIYVKQRSVELLAEFCENPTLSRRLSKPQFDSLFGGTVQ